MDSVRVRPIKHQGVVLHPSVFPTFKGVFKGLQYIQKVVIVDVVGPEMIHSGLIFIGALIVKTQVIAHVQKFDS